MAIRRILQLGDPLLRETSEPCSPGIATEGVLNDLRDTLAEFRRVHGFGRGISAIQIGVPERIIYIEFEGRSYSLLNPEWLDMSEERFRLWDDCFCFPDLLVFLERSSLVRIRYSDQEGHNRTLEAAGALAELIQHEMDHLDGILAIDRAIDSYSVSTREEWVRQHGSQSEQQNGDKVSEERLS